MLLGRKDKINSLFINNLSNRCTKSTNLFLISVIPNKNPKIPPKINTPKITSRILSKNWLEKPNMHFSKNKEIHVKYQTVSSPIKCLLNKHLQNTLRTNQANQRLHFSQCINLVFQTNHSKTMWNIQNYFLQISCIVPEVFERFWRQRNVKRHKCTYMYIYL